MGGAAAAQRQIDLREKDQYTVPTLPATSWYYDGLSASSKHFVLLRSDGHAVAAGCNSHGQCALPEPGKGLEYISVATGAFFTVAIQNDGSVVACGDNCAGQCDVSAPQAGAKYVDVSAGSFFTILLRDDGHVDIVGSNSHGQCDAPPPLPGTAYELVAAGDHHVVLLRSDGQVVIVGSNGCGQRIAPRPPPDCKYTRVAAGAAHTVLLRSDGQAVAFGDDAHHQCRIPLLPHGMQYTNVLAGGYHTVLIRSDGSAVSCGRATDGQCNVPTLPDDFRFVAGAAGDFHTLLLRSDGAVVAFGDRIHPSSSEAPRPGRSRFVSSPQASTISYFRTVWSLAERSMSVEDLLVFYFDVFAGSCDVNATTREVVQSIIIPKTAEEAMSWVEYNGLARCLDEEPVTHVVHCWDMRFTELVKAVLNDVLPGTHGKVDNNLGETRIRYRDFLSRRFWICCFAVNQHRTMCKEFNCPCASQNYECNSSHCEVDKFHEVLEDLKTCHAGKVLVAIDKQLQVFRRAWCAYEVHLALLMGLSVTESFASFPSLLQLRDFEFDVRDCAARQTDKDMLMRKIANTSCTRVVNAHIYDFVQSLADVLVTGQRRGLLTVAE